MFYFENSFVLLLFYFEFWTENINGAQYFVFGTQAQLLDCPRARTDSRVTSVLWEFVMQARDRCF